MQQLETDLALRCRSLAGTLAIALAVLRPPVADAAVTGPGQAQGLYGQLPLTFEANLGQMDPQVAFLARGTGYALFLTPTEAVLRLRPGTTGGQAAPGDRSPAAEPVLRLRLRGANPAPRLTGIDPQAARSNYFLGNVPSHWRTGVPHFGRVQYESVYPGVDLIYYGRQRQLEFDFVLQPGADPRAIELEFDGAERIEADARGDLVIHLAGGALRQHKPVAYQERDGERQPVSAAYVVKGPRAAHLRLGHYDRSRPLVIDPILAYSTYLGGAGRDQASGIAVDNAGRACVTGSTYSTDFPTANAIQPWHVAWTDVFVTKLSADGSALVYSTYLGGEDEDYGLAVAIDGSGNCYVTGSTWSRFFPNVNALQPGHGGAIEDAFVAKLSPDGSALVYSTYLGGQGDDVGQAIAADGSGNCHVTGYTYSPNFPTANPLQGAHAGGYADAFVTKLNATGSAFAYSTYLGGSGWEGGGGVAVDSAGSTYVVGTTTSTDFPTVNPVQAANAGQQDAFVVKLDGTGSTLGYATYLGGSRDDVGYGIALSGSGDAYVVGDSWSTDWPTFNPFQATHGGANDAFVARLAPAGSGLVYSTYLGGNSGDAARGVAVDGAGDAYVTGHTASPLFPTAHPIQGVLSGIGDAFVTKLSASGSTLLYSTFLGGSGSEAGWGIAVDSTSCAHVAGSTSSADFPMVSSLQAAYGGGSFDGFVAKIAAAAMLPSFTKGDLNRDGHPDLVFRSNVDGTQNKVWFMDGVRRTAEAAISPAAAGADWTIRGIDDFNGDHNNDLVFWNRTTGNVEFWLMNGTARVGQPVPLAGGAHASDDWDLAATADLNHDNNPDLVWRDLTSQKLVIWTMNGTTKLGNVIPTPDQAVDGNWAIVAALDYTNDGNVDFLWYNSTSGKVVTWYMDAAVVRTSGQFTTPASAGDHNWKVVASSDYSGNYVPGTPPLRSPDIVWHNESSGKQVVWHLDFDSTRVHGQFTDPAADTPALDWTVVGPR